METGPKGGETIKHELESSEEGIKGVPLVFSSENLRFAMQKFSNSVLYRPACLKQRYIA
jgi:hypothetical protein